MPCVPHSPARSLRGWSAAPAYSLAWLCLCCWRAAAAFSAQSVAEKETHQIEGAASARARRRRVHGRHFPRHARCAAVQLLQAHMAAPARGLEALAARQQRERKSVVRASSSAALQPQRSRSSELLLSAAAAAAVAPLPVHPPAPSPRPLTPCAPAPSQPQRLRCAGNSQALRHASRQQRIDSAAAHLAGAAQRSTHQVSQPARPKQSARTRGE